MIKHSTTPGNRDSHRLAAQNVGPAGGGPLLWQNLSSAWHALAIEGPGQAILHTCTQPCQVLYNIVHACLFT